MLNVYFFPLRRKDAIGWNAFNIQNKIFFSLRLCGYYFYELYSRRGWFTYLRDEAKKNSLRLIGYP